MMLQLLSSSGELHFASRLHIKMNLVRLLVRLQLVSSVGPFVYVYNLVVVVGGGSETNLRILRRSSQTQTRWDLLLCCFLFVLASSSPFFVVVVVFFFSFLCPVLSAVL